MRYKSLTIDRRSLGHSSEEKTILSDFSDGVNQLGKFFDSLIELENVVIEGLEKELSDLVLTRQKRKELEEKFGKERYIKEFFIPSANKVENKLNEILNSWKESLTSDYSCEKIVEVVHSLKGIKSAIDVIEKTIPGFVAIESLKNLLNEFGRFKVVKVCMAEKITDKINYLLEIYNSAVDKSTEEILSEAGELKEIEDISIDDL